MKERLHYIDIAKGILILFLPIHHYASATRRLDISSNYEWIITYWQFLITPFFMAAFFILSGYCSSFEKVTVSTFIKSVFRKIIIPIVFFQILVLAGIALYTGNLEYFNQSMLNPPYTTLWFLWALLFAKSTTYIISNFFYKQSVILFVSFIFLICGCLLNYYKIGINVLAIYQSLIASFFVAFGYYLKKHKEIFERILKYSFIYPILIVFLRFFHLPIPSYTAGINISLLTIPLFVVLTIFGTAFLLNICKKINKFSFIEYFGRNSLVIYCFHFIPLYILVDIIWHFFVPTTLITFLMTVILIYLLEYLICYLASIFFHKKPLAWFVGY